MDSGLAAELNSHVYMSRRAPYLETFFISLAVILLEVNYTRVFSYKLVYYFSYLVIGLSLLGLGAGGVAVAVFPRIRRTASARLIALCCLLGAAAVLLGYFVVARLQVSLFQLIGSARAHDLGAAVGQLTRLIVICGTLFLPFLAAGIALATIFATNGDRINRLYCVDLLGAGLGCALSVPLMASISPPGAVLLAGFFFGLGGWRGAAAEWRALRLPLGAVTLALLACALGAWHLPDVVPDRIKTEATGSLYSRWSPVFRVDVMPTPVPQVYFLIHDGTLGSSMMRYDGNPSSLAHFDVEDRSFPFRLLPPAPKVAIIGAAGGKELLASIYFQASHVTGVELNPVTVSLLTTHFADFTGHLTENPRVTLVNAEGRSFMGRSQERYDLIWFVAPDSYAAMNAATSGAFVLSESYLYTREMIVEALRHLTDGGILCAQFGEISYDVKPNRTVRYLGTAREAFHELGIDDFDRHVLVATSPGFGQVSSASILLKRAPFDAADVRVFEDAAARIEHGAVRFAWNRANPEGPVSAVITRPSATLAAWYRAYPFDVRPVRDDSPFFWHFVRFTDTLWAPRGAPAYNVEEGIGERLLLVLVGVATLFAALFLLAPMLAIRHLWVDIPYKTSAGVYFAALGLGFMFLEVSLIQRLTLFLGYPTYSLTVTLFALLVSTGLGSLVSERLAGRRNAALCSLAGVLLLLVLLYQRGLPLLAATGVGWPFGVRVAVAIAALSPLGLCLGAFMPLGLRTVAAVTRHGEVFVAWSWAVNGFFSVVSSVLATILSMIFGFDHVMLAGVGVYAIGIAALLRIPPPGEVAREPEVEGPIVRVAGA
jgi:MFS family permease